MSVYTKAKLGESDNQILLNDTSSDPYYRVRARTANKWQIRQQDLPIPFESGSSDFETLIGDAAHIIVGTMYPSSETKYDAGLVALRTIGSLDFNQNDPSSDIGYIPYIWGDASGDYSKQIFIKPLYVDIAETTSQGYVQPFTIISKIKDPTIYGVDKSASTQAANFSQTTGAMVLSVAFPVVIGSTSFTVSSTATNDGSIASYPTSIVVHGPVNVPKITNTATGEYIKVNCNLTTTADVLTITYDKDTFTIDLNGISQIQNLASDSTLFKIQPGTNVISLTGTSVSTSAYAVVNYRDSYPLA